MNSPIRLFVPFLAFAVLGSAADGRKTCEELSAVQLRDTTITAAQTVAEGTFTPPGAKPLNNLPAFCRVAGVIKPTADSHIEFEVWMPRDGWKGKFQGIGNGGFAGAISYGPGGLDTAIQSGYAAASTDTGHKGSGIDASWALGHPEKIVDFGHRAIHEMTVKAKALIQAYYGKPPAHSYFASCSNGGRQALMEAQRYPADYDGIISGAPAAAWTATMAGFVWNTQALSAPGAFIPPSKLETIAKAVVAACDAKDGVNDGILEDPRTCGYDPSVTVCTGTESDSCLSSAQAAALKKIYDGPRNRAGALLFPGFDPGAETGPGGWGNWITGQAPGQSLQATFATQFARNMVFDRPDWQISSFDFDRDMKIVNDKMGSILNATNPDLSAFKARGGKLILFHGWNDPALPARRTIEYYNAVRAKLGVAQSDSFVRLYMVPGLQHCFGGIGATYCGGLNVSAGDPSHDLSAALERWVESGTAPGPVIAQKFERPMDVKSRAVASHLVCPFPQVASYKGTGDPSVAANFTCKAP